jgi:hypothetical protein
MNAATDRRAVLGAVLAGGAAAVTTLPTAQAAATPAFSAIDRRVLDLWNRRRRLEAGLDELFDQLKRIEEEGHTDHAYLSNRIEEIGSR